MCDSYSVYSDFDVDLHKKTFINYCEVIIDPHGTIHYAIPSHTVFLEKYGAHERNMSVDEFLDLCPQSMYANYITWLLDETGCVSCWSKGFKVGSKLLTCEQIQSLQLLIDEGLVGDLMF